jgi:antitoxin component of RelBE/YafQ-DinJ toxin-antitoxin module
MKNITLAIDEETLVLGKKYAKKHSMSFNELVRTFLKKTIEESSISWLDTMFEEMDRDNVSSEGRKWTRGELYRA